MIRSGNIQIKRTGLKPEGGAGEGEVHLLLDLGNKVLVGPAQEGVVDIRGDFVVDVAQVIERSRWPGVRGGEGVVIEEFNEGRLALVECLSGRDGAHRRDGMGSELSLGVNTNNNVLDRHTGGGTVSNSMLWSASV